MTTSKRAAYHHGNLRDVLIQTGIALLEERGLSGFSLREVARRASVVPAAPAHHFGNLSGLVTAIAVAGFDTLLVDFERIVGEARSVEDRLCALCTAYIAHFRKRSGMASVMFRWDMLRADDAELLRARARLREVLKTSVIHALPEGSSDEQVERATVAIWTATHGLVALELDGRTDLDAHVSFYVSAIVGGDP